MNSELWIRAVSVIARFNDIPEDQLATVQQIITPVIEGTSLNSLIAAQVGNIKSIRTFKDHSSYSKIERSAMGTDILTIGTTNYYIALYRVGEERNVRLGIYGDGLPAFFFRIATDAASMKKFMSNSKITPVSLIRVQDGNDLYDVLSYTSENSELQRYLVIFIENGIAAPPEYDVAISLETDGPAKLSGKTGYFK